LTEKVAAESQGNNSSPKLPATEGGYV